MKKLVRNISVSLVALLCVFCLVFGLAACGGSSYSNSYKFEAEWTDTVSATYGTRSWAGYSQQGTPFRDDSGASNGYCMSAMYISESYLFFDIVSDGDAEAELYACMTMDYDCMQDTSANSVTLTDTQYSVSYGPSGTSITSQTYVEYGEITFSMRGLKDIETHNAFKEYDLGKIELVEGKNVIVFQVTNLIHGQGGSQTSIAPLLDYIRIDTNASLTWDPLTSNVS